MVIVMWSLRRDFGGSRFVRIDSGRSHSALHAT